MNPKLMAAQQKTAAAVRTYALAKHEHDVILRDRDASGHKIYNAAMAHREAEAALQQAIAEECAAIVEAEEA